MQYEKLNKAIDRVQTVIMSVMSGTADSGVIVATLCIAKELLEAHKNDLENEEGSLE